MKSPRVTAWKFKSLRGHSWGHTFDTIMPKTLATATVDPLLHHAHLVQSNDVLRAPLAPALSESLGPDHDDDAGHHERDADHEHRPDEPVPPPSGVIDQTHPVG